MARPVALRPDSRRASATGATVGVLLVHGARTTRTMWRSQLEALGRHGVPAHAIDLPGHGARAGERFTLAAAERAVDAGVRALGGPVLLVGLSLGGYVAISYAGRHPEACAGLVAASCATVPGRTVVGGYLALAALVARLPDRGARLNQWMVDATLPPDGALDVAAGGFTYDVMSPMLREVRRIDPLSSLRRVDHPVWIVNGRRDHFRAHERRYLRACRDGRLVLIPRAKHLCSLEAPVAFTRVLLGAVEELGAVRG